MVEVSSADVTAEYTTARAELLATPGLLGAARRKELVALTDSWLSALFKAAGGATVGGALVAVGGFGRRELAPGSDLDLILLHPVNADLDAVTAVADRLWYPVWDTGIRLDHSVRAPAQARRLAAQDLKVMLGLLDARTVAGDEALTRGVRESVLADWRAFSKDRLPELHRSVQKRTDRSGELAHLLEPDLKESHGGLRDVSALRAIAASWITDASVGSLTEAHSLLLDARDALHLATGRSSDRLLQQEQPAVAHALGYQDADQMLRAVSQAGRAIAFASDTTWHRVLRLTERSSTNRVVVATRRLRPAGTGERSPLAEGVVVQGGEAVLASGARPELDPVLILRAAAAAAQAGLRLAPHAVERLATRSAPLPEPWPAQARDSLVSLLGAGRSALPVWEALDQAGVWTRLLPSWEVIRSAPQRNPVHQYTVDRHLVETAVAAATHAREVARPDLLLVGALLHDVGKGRSGDHTEVGMRLVSDIAPRLGYDDDDTETLVRMVEHHLLLPEVATRRDLDDPATVAAVAAAVRTPDFLDLLHALTEADAAATGPAAWSDWKKALIDDLVLRTRSVLAGQVVPAPPRTTTAQRALAAAMTAADAEGVQVLMESNPDSAMATVVVAAPDRTGLLSVVAGVLALHRLQVRAAQVDTVTTERGARAVQVWSVLPHYGEPPAVDRLREDITRALGGSLDVRGRLAVRELAYSGGKEAAPPRVDLVPGASQRATVVEVRAHDIPGLLHRVAGAIAAIEGSIVAARVATLGSEVVDVFYVVEPDGTHLTAEREERLRSAALAELTAVPMTDSN